MIPMSAEEYIGNLQAELAELKEENKRLRVALENLRDAVCTATNWGLLMLTKVGDAPWISQEDAVDVYGSLAAASEALHQPAYVSGIKIGEIDPNIESTSGTWSSEACEK